jgi:hypothetical protein
MNSLDRILSIVAKPERVIDAGNEGEWRNIEDKIGFHLPSDYKLFIQYYGTGALNDFLYVFNPFTLNKNLNLLSQREDMIDSYRILKYNSPEKYPFSANSDVGGLLPWGITDNGDELYWLITGKDSNQWKIVSFKASDSYYETHDLTLTEYLAQLLEGRLKTHLYPDDFRNDKNRYFTPMIE